MRTLTLVSLMVLLIATVPLLSQTVVISDVVLANRSIANSTTYTSADLPIVYTGNIFPNIKFCTPDSIKVVWEAVAPGDSNDIKVYISKGCFGNAVQSYTLVDSIKDDELDKYSPARSTFTSADVFKIRLISAAAGNLRQNLWVRYERYFTLP